MFQPHLWLKSAEPYSKRAGNLILNWKEPKRVSSYADAWGDVVFVAFEVMLAEPKGSYGRVTCLAQDDIDGLISAIHHHAPRAGYTFQGYIPGTNFLILRDFQSCGD